MDNYVTEALTFSLKKDYGPDLPDDLVNLVAKKKWLGQNNDKLDFLPPPELRGRGIGTRSPKGKQPGRGGQIGIEEHHLLPQNKVMKDKFKAAEIDVEDFTIALDFDLHRQIHNPKGLANQLDFDEHWNSRWKTFFEEVEKIGASASKKQVFEFASKLVKEFRLQ